MFNKPNPPKNPHAFGSEPRTPPPPPSAASPAPAPEPAPVPAQPKAPARIATSMLGAGLVFEGAISGEVDLAIEGTILGEVDVTRLFVGENAVVEGHIRAHHVEVRGRVVGDIEAQAVRLTETAHVQGDIAHGQLSIDIGAHFEGRCHPLRRGEAVVSSGGAQVVDLDSARA